MVEHKFLRQFIFITVLVFMLDQFTKYLVVRYNPFWKISIFSITLSTNTGAGFGLLQGKTIWLTLISALVALGIVMYYRKIPNEKVIQGYSALFLGGVIGNLADRIVHHQVIDFITISWWPSFNIADAAISIAALGMIIYSWKK